MATHPVQYQAPWFRALTAAGLDLDVLFGVLPDAEQQGAGFGIPFEWDVPLLDGYRWRALELRGSPDLVRFFGLRVAGMGTAVRALRPQALLSTGWNSWMLVQALRAARRARVPVVVRGDSNSNARRPLWKRLAHRWFLGRFAAFLVVGSASRAFFRNAGVADAKLFPAPHFIDNRAFAEAAAVARRERDGWRQRWGVGADAVCALFAGKLVPKKRPADLLRALARLGAEPRPRHLLVVGDGPLRAELERDARSVGLPVTFTGFLNQSEIPAAYAAADFLVLPSDEGETWGLVVNEGMACGLPALVSDRVGCAPDLVLPGRTGAIFRCGDVDSLAASWRSLEADASALPRMGEEAREHVFATHSVERAVEGTLAALRYVTATP